MGIMQADLPEHQEQRDGNHHCWQHTLAEDVKQQVTFTFDWEPAEGIGRENSQNDR